ncbi:MAG: zinc metallopeptidase [Bacilli bacterium]|nr:zinc metallopeptidase [Bacilli bacterium]
MNGFILGYDNLLTTLLLIAGFLIVIYAQTKINRSYSKNKEIENKKQLTGQEIARHILDANGLSNIYIVKTNGHLTDHYDPTRKVVKLSNEVYDKTSIASMAIAAHECGHALQDKDNYTFMKIRSTLVPIVNFISHIGYFILFISILAGMTGYILSGIIIILATLVFQLITLPVEFDASKRALLQLEKLNLVDENNDEVSKTNEVLSAAAFTYVASVISSLLSLLRLLIIYQDKD